MAKVPEMKRLATCLLASALVALAGAAGAVEADDPRLSDQWGLTKIGAPTAWSRSTGDGAIIAIVDSGVDLGHEDLKSKIVAQVNCIGADDDAAKCGGSAQDDHGHGTHVAGIAAAATNNGKGVAGTAPEARIMAVKVLEADVITGDATGSIPDVRAGIRWAVDHGAHVVNLSLGENVFFRGLFGTGLYDAIEYAWNHGVVVAVAAGNRDSLFDSGYEGVDALVVTATKADDQQAGYATDIGGARWGIAAPGGEKTSVPNSEILSTWWEPTGAHHYAYSSGTSMATPFVAGAAAVLRSGGLSPKETIDRLLATATDLGRTGEDSVFGYGLLNLAHATEGLGSGTEAIEPPPTTPPPPPAAAPPSPPKVAAKAVRRSAPAPTEPAPTAPPTTAADPAPAVASQPAPAPPPAKHTSGGPAPWIIIGATVVAVGVGTLRALARRRGVATG